MKHFYAALLSNGKYLADERYYHVSTKDPLCSRRYADKQQLKEDRWLKRYVMIFN